MKNIEFRINLEKKIVLLNNILKGRTVISSKQNPEFERIIEYSDEYNEKIYNFIINICIREYGFEEWKTEIEKMLWSEYKNNNGNFWIAVNEKDEVIGTIGLNNINNENCKLKTFYVDENYRGAGISKKLYNTCMSFAQDNGFQKMVLETYERFNRAIGFYKKNGFVQIEKNGELLVFERFIVNNVIEIEDNYAQDGNLEYLEYNVV